MKRLGSDNRGTNESIDDARHAARAILGGVPLDLTTEQVFAELAADPTFSKRDLREMRRGYDALMI
jgi:hypothetical protein